MAAELHQSNLRRAAIAKIIRESVVHKQEELELNALSPELLDDVAKTLDRVNKWALSIAGGTLYLTIGEKLFETTVQRLPM